MPFYVYKTVNNINSRYYIGVHKTDNFFDQYLGSGLAIKKAISYYGKDNFTKHMLFEYNNEQEAYRKEWEIVSQHINDPKCYNLMEGGMGGFDHINNKRHLYVNPMKNPEVVKKNLESRKNGYEKDEKRVSSHKEKRKENLKAAIIVNTGKKRPEHAIKMQSHMKELWKTKRDSIVDALSDWYVIVDPQGIEHRTNRLGCFCETNNIPFTTMWCNTLTDNIITKGKAKGWKCKKI